MIRIHSGAIPGCAALSGSDYSCRRAHMLVCCACAWLRLLAIRLVNMMRYVSKKIGQIGDKLQVKLKSGSCQQLITGFTSSLKSFYAARGRKPQFFDTARFSSCPPLQAPASQSPAPTERFSSFQLDVAFVGGDAMQAPTWLQSGGQVDYTNMTQHVLQAKRSLQVCLVVIQITVLQS